MVSRSREVDDLRSEFPEKRRDMRCMMVCKCGLLSRLGRIEVCLEPVDLVKFSVFLRRHLVEAMKIDSTARS
jgi:hypothetical protein